MTSKTKNAALPTLALLSCSLVASCAGDQPGVKLHATASEPSDVDPTCVIANSDLSKWFADGTITANGLVKPANSLVDFETACEFYKWSWQMFLWQMSPNGDSLVFNTPPFYDVDSSGNLTSNDSGKSNLKRIRGAKPEDVESTGQAGVISGVLMTQDVRLTPGGSLVYYGIHVNDVYAYMASGKNSGSLTRLTSFPTTKTELDQITSYAKSVYNVDIQDGEALTLELKSSWVKVDPAADLSDYITIQADIPLYTKESETKWTWDGQAVEEDVVLACIGYHLVGTSANHPEMIWATFEHVSNSPDANYFYMDASGTVKEWVNWNADGTPKGTDWLLMSSTGTEQATDQMHMEMKGTDIVATQGNVISASNTIRTHPWGGEANASSAPNNTDIISLNQSVRSQLAEGDPRGNYFLVGATWTRNGVPGIGDKLPDVAGSLTLANSTMETYFQYKNCFDCHTGGEIDGLSHIFSSIKPLPKPE